MYGEIVKTIELCNVVLGILLNSLLLVLIIYSSKPQLGNYRNLLKVFTLNDILMATLHAIVRPSSFSSGSALGVFSYTYPRDKHPLALTCGWYTVPFTLMNINFLHRFWSVRSPHKIKLFSSPVSAMTFALYPIIMAFLWYLACISLSDNSIGKAILQRWITEFDGVAIDDGWLVLHFWEGDSLHTRGAITLLCGGAIIYSNFAVAIVLFCLTIHYLKSDNMLSISASYRRFQFKILRALFAQSAIPILLVYIPCGLGVTLPLFFNNDRKGGIDPWFTLISSFPSFDAVVIILLIKDYRDGLLSMVHRKNCDEFYHYTDQNSMTTAREVVEFCNVAFGSSLNFLLLFFIVRCSRPQLGNYRHLLKIFACNDIMMVMIHAFVKLASFSAGPALGVHSDAFPDDKYLISITCAWFTVPFTLMNINFLHRFWSVRSPHKIKLFSSPWFALKLLPYPGIMAFLWLASLTCFINHSPSTYKGLLFFFRFG